MKCSELTDILAKYLEDKMSDDNVKIPDALANHLSECEDCSRLVNDPRLARYYLNIYKKQSLKPIAQEPILCHQLIKKPGQLWRFGYGENGSVRMCLISSESFNTSVDAPYAVWIIPVKLNPISQEVSDSDIIIDNKSTNIKLPILVEFWNKCPIYVSQLLEYQDSLPDKLWDKITDRIENPPQEELPNVVRIFRENEFKEGELFAQSFLNNERNSIPTISYDKTSIWLTGIKEKFDEFVDTLNNLVINPTAALGNTNCYSIVNTTPRTNNSRLDSLFNLFNSTNLNKLKIIADKFGGLMKDIFINLGDVSLEMLCKSTTTFKRIANIKDSVDICGLAKSFKTIEKNPDKTEKCLSQNVTPSVPYAGFINILNIHKEETVAEPDFKIETEDNKLISITSAKFKKFVMTVICRECYFTFETSTGEIALSSRRLNNFGPNDITSITIETEPDKFVWEVKHN